MMQKVRRVKAYIEQVGVLCSRENFKKEGVEEEEEGWS